MGLLKHFRSRSRISNKDESDYRSATSAANGYAYQAAGHDCTQRLPAKVLDNIFAHLCPHTLDETYETNEQSIVGDGCMLCDLRDLANCARVRRGWYQVVQETL